MTAHRDQRGRGLVAQTAVMLIAAAVLIPAHAQADGVAYLVNVSVRPGYNFAGPQDALDYGNRLCDKVGHNTSYAQIMADVKADFQNPDEFQASYLISQSVNELCPAMIWQLRKSAAGHRAPG